MHPVLDSLNRDLDEITDFSDMRDARIVGQYLKGAINNVIDNVD